MKMVGTLEEIRAQIGDKVTPCPSLKGDFGAAVITRIEKGKYYSDGRAINDMHYIHGGEWSFVSRHADKQHSTNITEGYIPMTREQITAQIEALQKQLDELPVVVRKYWDGFHCSGRACGSHYFDIETVNGVPHIHGVAMKECGK